MTKKRPQTVTIVAFGDSITQAGHQQLDDQWPMILRRTLQGRFTGSDINVVNAGVGGNTSREGLARIEPDVLRHKPDFVLFEFGNDPTPEPERHVPVAEFLRNIDRIMARVSKEAGGCAIPMTFPPIIDRWHVWSANPFFAPMGGVDKCEDLYREATRQFARERSCPLIDIDSDLRKAIAQRGPESCILPDGIHLTAYGNERVALTVVQVLSPEIEKHIRLRSQPIADE